MEELKTTHYVCPECGGVSDEPGVCETEGCAMEGDMLEECHCEDGDHVEVIGVVPELDEEEDYDEDEDDDFDIDEDDEDDFEDDYDEEY